MVIQFGGSFTTIRKDMAQSTNGEGPQTSRVPLLAPNPISISPFVYRIWVYLTVSASLYLPLQPTLPATSTQFTCHFDPVYLPPRRPPGGTQHEAERLARWCEVPQKRYRLRGSLASGGGSGRDGVPPPSVTPAVADGINGEGPLGRLRFWSEMLLFY